MKFSPIELLIIGAYLLSMALVGVVVRRRAARQPDSHFLGDRNAPWWMLGLSGK
jgi:Na+/proline symporter